MGNFDGERDEIAKVLEGYNGRIDGMSNGLLLGTPEGRTECSLEGVGNFEGERDEIAKVLEGYREKLEVFNILHMTFPLISNQLPREIPANVSWTNQFPGGL